MRGIMKEKVLKIDMESKVLRLSIMVFLIESILYFISDNILGYGLFVDVYIGIVGIAIIIVMCIKDIDDNRGYLKYLLWGHLYIAFFLWMHIGEPTNIIREGKKEIVDILISLKLQNIYAVNIYKIIIITIFIYFYKNKVKLSRIDYTYFFISAFLYIFIGLNLNNYKIGLNTTYILIYILVYLGLLIFTIFSISKAKNQYKIRITKKIIIYDVLLLLANIWYIVTINNLDINLVYIQCSVRLFIHIYVFTNFEIEIRKLSAEQEMNKIQGEININKEFNINLTKKESILEELKSKTKLSINKTLNILDNLPDGMLIFQNSMLIYSNSEATQYFRSLLEVNLKELFMMNFLDFIIKDDISKKELELGFKRNIIVTDEIEKKRQVEIELIPIKDDVKVVVIKSNDYLIRSLQLEKEYSLYLEDEEVKDEFYSNISHELRTPINIISSALQLNEKILDDNKFDVIKRNNIIIKQNCNRLIRTINNFIDTNKITEGYLHIPKSKINIVTIIDNIAEVASQYVVKKNCKLVFDPFQEEIYIYANSESINRIFFNIISNSLKYGEENEIIFISAKVENDKVKINVEYKSREISKERIKNMFKKFSKCENYLTRDAEGSGLGLFITKKLVEHNSGNISFNYKDGQNIFEIIMPIDKSGQDGDSNWNLNINDLKRQADIEFSDIYF